MTVATAKAVIVWPDGKLPEPFNFGALSNQLSEKFPVGGMPLGRLRLVVSFKTVVRISASPTASPASSAVRVIFESFRISPMAYKDTGATMVPTMVALLEKTLLNP